MSRRSIICLSLWLGQISDLLLATADKERYFTQPRSMIVNLFTCDHVTSGCVKIRAKFEGKQISVSLNALSGFSIFSNCKTLQEEAISHLKIHFKVPLHRSHFPLAKGVWEKAKDFGSVILYLLTLASIQSVTESILFPTMAKAIVRASENKSVRHFDDLRLCEGHSIIIRKTRLHEDLWTFQREVFKRVTSISSNYLKFLYASILKWKNLHGNHGLCTDHRIYSRLLSRDSR